jgi:hypothetical protein
MLQDRRALQHLTDQGQMESRLERVGLFVLPTSKYLVEIAACTSYLIAAPINVAPLCLPQAPHPQRQREYTFLLSHTCSSNYVEPAQNSIHTCKHTCTNINKCSYFLTYSRRAAHKNEHTYTQAATHASTHFHTHTHTHTHTHSHIQHLNVHSLARRHLCCEM